MNARVARLAFASVLASVAACGSNDSAAIEMPPPPPAVSISEIMYHPVDENSAVERHEYIEI